MSKEDYPKRYMEQSELEHERWQTPKPQAKMSRSKFAKETLARYSNTEFEEFQPFVLLTNFPEYVALFAEIEDTEMKTGSVLNIAHSKKREMTIIDYQLGAPMAALVMDLLSYTNPQVVLMLGLCGGLHRSHKVGDFLLPMAAIRDEGASRHYMPAQVPSLPALLVQQFVSQTLLEKEIMFKTGVIHTTDYRMWEFDQAFIDRLKSEKASAIDMECSALFTSGFKSKVPVGALMLVTDLPLVPGAQKTKALSDKVFKEYRKLHLEIGIDALQKMREAKYKQKLNFRRFSF